MDLTTKNGASFYQFKKFNRLGGVQPVSHAIFTRKAGYSKGPFGGLNITLGIGDDDHNVEKNRRIISRCFGGRNLVFARQVHGDHVLVIDSRSLADGNDHSMPVRIGDALITNLQQTYLCIQVADCQAVMLVDPRRKVVANVHVGWRGSINGIIPRTLGAMVKHYGCQAHDVVAGIGPSLGPCCAEFVNYKKEIPEKFWPYKDAAHHFDFWAISRDQLVAGGVLSENIAVSHMCTKCNPELFFSYRAEGTTGRFAAVIGLE